MFVKFLNSFVSKIKLFFWNMFFKRKFMRELEEKIIKFLWESDVEKIDDLVEQYNKYAFSKLRPSLSPSLKLNCYKKYKYVVLDISDGDYDNDAPMLILTSDKSEKIKEKYGIGAPSSTVSLKRREKCL